jgi:polar amino acid transport system permease protein
MVVHVVDLLPNLLRGAAVTVEVTAAASVLALVLSLPVALARLSPAWPLRLLGATYVEILRGTSALVQLFYLFFILPLFGVRLDPLPTAIIGLGLNFSAYASEIVRGAILGVDRGQWEAAAALHLSHTATLRRIVLPQAVAVMLPSLASLLIQLLKSTALVSLITLSDLTFAGQALITATGRPFVVWGLVLAFYYVLSLPLEWAAGRLESHAAAYRATAYQADPARVV